MISEGTPAPSFELPALVDGERRRVSLSDYVGEDVVILAFYPADFNPACDEESCDLDELDLFTMQKDVTILGISPDSVYSHRVFAERYDLRVPLLSDTDGTAAAKYDVELTDDIGQHLVERAVVVVDHDGNVQYTWSTDEMRQLPKVDVIKDAIAETGGDDTAFARYRVGHAHYTEGRRAFTAAMEGFQQSEWLMAQNDFQQAREEFEEAAGRFDTAVRFVDDESLVGVYEDAHAKATSLWQAADWLTEAASAYSSGSGAKGQELRDDAEGPLETARGYAEPPDPDGEWPPGMASLEQDGDDGHGILPTEEDTEDATLAVDIDEQLADVEEIPVGDEGDAGPVASDGARTDGAAEPSASATATDDHAGTDAGSEGGIDDDELAEIQAELEASNPDEEPSVDEIAEESTAIVEAPQMGDDGAEDEVSERPGGEGPADESGHTEERRFAAGRTLELTDRSDEEKARDELAALQAELGVELPGSDLSEGGEDDGDRREFTQGKTLNLTDPTGSDGGNEATENPSDGPDDDSPDTDE